MTTFTLLMIATLFQLATAQQESTTIPLVVLDRNGKGTCPSLEERDNGLLAIRKQVSAILDRIIPECGDGLWYRVAYLNMTDPSQQCPPTWRLYNVSGVRACGRPVTSGASCPATFYTTGRQYSKVCGRVTGYQVSTPDAFNTFNVNPPPSSVDDIYVDGVSITHGNPRSHIWTFAAGMSEAKISWALESFCPCSEQGAIQSPFYIGDYYYCETGSSSNTVRVDNFLYSGDPLWDGKQCEGQCCSNGKSPPWFSVELPTSTTDDIEVRICADEGTNNEDTPVSLVEIFVK